MGLLYNLGKRIIPDVFERRLEAYVRKAGRKTPYPFVGFMFIASIITAILAYFLLFQPALAKGIISVGTFRINIGIFSFFFYTIILIILSYLISLLLFYAGFRLYVDIRIYNRTKKIEEILPDYLSLVSTNLKAGMPFDKALWNAVQKRHEVLADEIEIVSKSVMTGKDVEEALRAFSKKYDSDILKRSIELIVEGMTAGAKMADLIDRVVDNLKQTMELKKEMAASATAYVMFISLIAVVIAPALFALSFNLLIIIQDLGSKLGTTTVSSVIPLKFGEISIKPSDFRTFSILSISVIALFSSLIVSIVERGDIKGSYKYIPGFIAGSILVYLGLLKVLTSAFGGFF